MTRSLSWMDDALCREIDGELFFTEDQTGANQAKRVCAMCPVTTECLTYALAHRVDGVWAGTSARERQQLRGAAYRRQAS
jgi:WhiB family redox-sensing transcriptional regulator